MGISACETAVDSFFASGRRQCLRDNGGQFLCKRVGVSACETVVVTSLTASGNQCLRDSGGQFFCKWSRLATSACEKRVIILPVVTPPGQAWRFVLQTKQKQQRGLEHRLKPEQVKVEGPPFESS